MNIRTSACYLAGGLYFLLFAAACTCSPSGKISGGQEQAGPVQQIEAPAAASASENNDDMIVEGEAVESGEVMVDDGSTVVESSVSESSEGEVIEGEVVEEGSTEGTVEGTVDDGSAVVESSEGEVVTDSTVVESSETTVTEGGNAAGTNAGDEMMMNSSADGQPVME